MILSAQVKIIRDLPFRLNKKDVLRGMGMSSSSTVRPEIDRLIDAALRDKEVLKLIRPAFAYAVHTIRRMEPDHCCLEGGVVLNGEIIPRVFAGAEKLAVAFATIGPELETAVTECFRQGKRLYGLILDAIGTSTAENMIFAIHDSINREAVSGGTTASSPVCPGGATWPITEQFKLFALAPADEIGVHLTDTAMMTPRKSMSLVMGLGEDMPTWSAAERCNRCSNGESCPYRYHPEWEGEHPDFYEKVCH
jgi:hypothetical protein